MELYSDIPTVREKELLDKFTAVKRVDTIDNELAKEFVYFWLWHRKPIPKIDAVDNILALLENYDFDFEYLNNTIQRLLAVNKEIDRYLQNPVIHCMPTIIDFERYKKCNYKRNAINTEQGFYKIAEIFSGYTVVLKKINSGRFIRLNLDKEIIKYVKIDDFMNITASQNLFLGWDLIHVYGYYPVDAVKFIQ